MKFVYITIIVIFFILLVVLRPKPEEDRKLPGKAKKLLAQIQSRGAK